MQEISEYLESQKKKQGDNLDKINQNIETDKELDESNSAYLVIPKGAKQPIIQEN